MAAVKAGKPLKTGTDYETQIAVLQSEVQKLWAELLELKKRMP